MAHNAITIAARLIALGLCPVALKSADDPEELLKPVNQRGKRCPAPEVCVVLKPKGITDDTH